MLSLLPVFFSLSGYPMVAAVPDRPLVELKARTLPANLVQNDAKAQPAERDGKPVLRVRFHKVDWPSVHFKAPDETWDWSGTTGFAVDVYNPETEPLAVNARVDNAGADGAKNCNTGHAMADPGRWTTLKIIFNTGEKTPFWGMRGVPVRGPLGKGPAIDLSKITAFQVFLPRPSEEHTLLLTNFRLFGDGKADLDVPLPFVDKFGQYEHADWPGKLKTETELVKRRIAEERSLESSPALPGLDRYGGWADGPKLKATGWFRTEQYNGKWWLVTPEGHLFFSLGVDCLGTGQMTFIEKREPWFEWLPDPDGRFKPACGYYRGAHSYAEAIDGKGRTFSFYQANLIRKYGDDWEAKWRDNSYARLRSWGFNTIGNWSQTDVLENSRLPFVATAGVRGNFRRIEGGGGYWAKMPDVYDPKFAEAAEASVGPAVNKFASNPLCIGYFVDNEIAWDAVERGPLASPPDQPCRVEQVRMLEQKYGSLDGLNKAWDTDAKSWEDLRVPDQPNEACRKDLDDFVYAFAHRYFEIVSSVVHKNAPNQLYLGCRFAWSHKEAVRACAEVADVVSFNIYRRSVECKNYDLGKPIIIGEFHFGALDRGMFHQGLVATANQNDRAESFKRYVESVIDCPSFVGCHWFQYIDEPLTGRCLDGENYNMGLVNVTDTPYPEMIAAARKVSAELYRRRL